MPQGRIILKSISQSRKLSELKTDGARLLYTWLIPNLDIEGRFSGDEDVIKGQLFTRLKKTVREISKYLTDLAEVGLIIWYECENDKYLQVPDFMARQPSLNPSKEAKSTIPAPTPAQLQSNSVPTPPKVKGSKVKQSKPEYSEEFLKFWENYPRRVGKKKAFTAWQKEVDGELLKVLAGIERCQKHEWKTCEPKFIPHPATWLNGRRWEDEVVGNKAIVKKETCDLCDDPPVVTIGRKKFCPKHSPSRR